MRRWTASALPHDWRCDLVPTARRAAATVRERRSCTLGIVDTLPSGKARPMRFTPLDGWRDEQFSTPNARGYFYE
jgi:hypothetical protein